MRKIKHIVIHCADTYPSMDIGVQEIDKWHKDRGWNGVGYHYVIRRNGIIEVGRMEQDIFAYVDDKADTDYVNTELGKKVDKEAGKGLSTNDYTNTEKNKLAGIEAEANKYEHPENHPASIITETTTKRFVTDAEKSSWNAKLDANKMQVVTELPASPATGVFYFVKE